MSNPNILMLAIPHEHCSGEPGEPLSPVVVGIIRGLQTAGYAPMGFGDLVVLEDHTGALELEFAGIDDPDVCKHLSDEFIRLGGDI